MVLEKGVQRWLVDISNWNPSPDHFTSLFSFLPQHHHSSISRFVKMEDQKRALVSLLLQYALVHQVLGIPFDQIIIKRTVEGKPYLESDELNLEFPNFNFNVSHHGDYVGIASEPICLVGMDIVSHFVFGKASVPDFIQNFKSYFSTLEWDNIMKASTDDEKLDEFYRYWCLKEAFVKAVGTGVGYRLDRVEFHHRSWDNISVNVDGNELGDWRFWLFDLGKRHSASIARGHPMAASESYKKTLKQLQFETEEEYNMALHLPNSAFLHKNVDELIFGMVSR